MTESADTRIVLTAALRLDVHPQRSAPPRTEHTSRTSEHFKGCFIYLSSFPFLGFCMQRQDFLELVVTSNAGLLA